MVSSAAIVQGRDDTVTPLEGVQDFCNEMQAHGNRCELHIYDQVDEFLTRLGYLES